MADDNPILNNPYTEPNRHYATNLDGELDYSDIRPGRRIFTRDIFFQSRIPKVFNRRYLR